MTFFNQLKERYEEGKTLPQEFYTDDEIFSDEMKKIYFKQWLMVDHVSRIPNPGDYFLFNAEKESIILIRGRDSQVRAFYNVCSHRGSRICLEEEGTKKLLVCPYHAWSFSAEGELKSARYMPDDFKMEDWGLKPCHMNIYQGLIFINLSMGEPMDFNEFIAPLTELVNFHNPEKAKIAARRKYPTKANFKLVLENFQECYHCGPAHPELCSVHEKDWVFTMGAGLGTAPEKETQEYLKKIQPWIEDCKTKGIPSKTYLETEEGLSKGLNRYVDRTPIGNGNLSQTKDGKPASKLMGQFKEFDGGLSQVSFNPFSCCYFTNDFGVMFIFKPLSILQSEVELIWLVNEEAEEGKDFNEENLTHIWDVTTAHDTTIIENNQNGLLSHSFSPGVLSQNESAVTYFYDWYFTNMRLP